MQSTIDRVDARPTASARSTTSSPARAASTGSARARSWRWTPTAAIRALIGGRDYAASQYDRAVAAKRQPGSSFKPFVYLAGVEKGLTPETVRDDAPINVQAAGSPRTTPTNISGR